MHEAGGAAEHGPRRTSERFALGVAAAGGRVAGEEADSDQMLHDAHTELVNTILEQSEDLISTHRMQIEETMELVRKVRGKAGEGRVGGRTSAWSGGRSAEPRTRLLVRRFPSHLSGCGFRRRDCDGGFLRGILPFRCGNVAPPLRRCYKQADSGLHSPKQLRRPARSWSLCFRTRRTKGVTLTVGVVRPGILAQPHGCSQRQCAFRTAERRLRLRGARLQEVNLVAEMDQPGSAVDTYVQQLSDILARKAESIAQLQSKVVQFQGYLRVRASQNPESKP